MDSFFEALDLSAVGFLAIFLAVFVGALVQGAIGFGLNLVAVPVIAVYQPAVLPAAPIIFALPMTLGSALRERAHIDSSAVFWTTMGRLPGVVLGAWVVSILTPEALSLVIGGIVVLAVLMSVASIRISIDRRSQSIVGRSSLTMKARCLSFRTIRSISWPMMASTDTSFGRPRGLELRCR